MSITGEETAGYTGRITDPTPDDRPSGDELLDRLQEATPAAQDPRRVYTAGLRALADFLDAHPDLPLPFRPTLLQWSTDARDEVDGVAAMLGVDAGPYLGDAGIWAAKRCFGPVAYLAVAVDRDEVQ